MRGIRCESEVVGDGEERDSLCVVLAFIFEKKCKRRVMCITGVIFEKNSQGQRICHVAIRNEHRLCQH
jgi:hypothetical protein